MEKKIKTKVTIKIDDKNENICSPECGFLVIGGKGSALSCNLFKSELDNVNGEDVNKSLSYLPEIYRCSSCKKGTSKEKKEVITPATKTIKELHVYSRTGLCIYSDKIDARLNTINEYYKLAKREADRHKIDYFLFRVSTVIEKWNKKRMVFSIKSIATSKNYHSSGVVYKRNDIQYGNWDVNDVLMENIVASKKVFPESADFFVGDGCNVEPFYQDCDYLLTDEDKK